MALEPYEAASAARKARGHLSAHLAGSGQSAEQEASTSQAGVLTTDCRVPWAPDPAGFADADVVVVGAPFDDGVSHRPGARFGPRAIRIAEDVGEPPSRPHMELGVDPFAVLRVVDHGDIGVVPAVLADSHAALETALGAVLAADAVPVVLGGDHSLSLAACRRSSPTRSRTRRCGRRGPT